MTQEDAAAVNNGAQPESTTDTGAAVETQKAVAETTTVPDLLTTEGFDFDKVKGLIDGSDLDGLKKILLVGALDQAKNNPDLLKAALDQVKSALGL